MDALPHLSKVERLILELLREQERFGLELVDQSAGALKRGTVYVTLARMEKKGYVTSRTEDPPPGAIGLPRRLYRPTAHGAAVLNLCNSSERLWARLRVREA